MLLSLLAWLKTSLITTFAKKNHIMVLIGAVCGACAFTFLPFAVEFNKKTVETRLFSPDAIANISLIVAVDFILTVGFCKSMMDKYFEKKRSMLLKLFSYIPSFLIIPAIGYLEITILFNFPGESFTKLSVVFALLLAASIPLTSGLIKFLLPEFSQRLKALASTCMLIVFLSVCCTIFHPETAIYHPADAIDWKNMLFTLIAIVGTCGIGWLFPIVKKHFK